MPLSPQQYYRQQTRAFVQAFDAVADHPIALQNPGQLGRLLHPGTWTWDPGVRVGLAFVRSRSGAPKEYWVHVDCDTYRPAFLAFLESEVGLPRRDVETSWHVDHVLNAAFARKHGLAYVRVALVHQQFNTGYGRVIEKRFTRMPAAGKSMYLLDYLVMMKLLHVVPPRNKAEYTRRRREIAGDFLASGCAGPENLILAGLDGTLDLWDVL